MIPLSQNTHKKIINADKEFQDTTLQPFFDKMNEIEKMCDKKIEEDSVVLQMRTQHTELSRTVGDMYRYESEYKKLQDVNLDEKKEKLNKLKEKNAKLKEDTRKVEETVEEYSAIFNKTKDELKELIMKKRIVVSFIQARCKEDIVEHFKKLMGFYWVK